MVSHSLRRSSPMPWFPIPQLTKIVCRKCLVQKKIILQSATWISTISLNYSSDGKTTLLSSFFTKEFHGYLLQQRSIKHPGEIFSSTVVLGVQEQDDVGASLSFLKPALSLSFTSQSSLFTVFGIYCFGSPLPKTHWPKLASWSILHPGPTKLVHIL